MAGGPSNVYLTKPSVLFVTRSYLRTLTGKRRTDIVLFIIKVNHPSSRLFLFPTTLFPDIWWLIGCRAEVEVGIKVEIIVYWSKKCWRRRGQFGENIRNSVWNLLSLGCCVGNLTFLSSTSFNIAYFVWLKILIIFRHTLNFLSALQCLFFMCLYSFLLNA